MLDGQFSRTALSAAGHRAAHQVLDEARVFADPLAGRILGDDYKATLAEGRDAQRRPLRMFVALRSRIAEDAAQRAMVARTRIFVDSAVRC